MKRYILSDATIAYRVSDDQYCVVLYDILAAVEAQSVVTDQGVQGWLADEENTFDLNISSGTISYGGRSKPVDASSIYDANGQLCVEAGEMSHWFPFTIDVDAPNATLWVTSSITLPVETRFGRKQKRNGLKGPAAAEDLPPVESNPFAWVSWPIVDYSLSGKLSQNPNVEGSALAVGELLKATATMNAQVSGTGNIEDVRLSFRRVDPTANLVGPIGATELAFGYTSSLATRFSSSARAGNGLYLSTFDMRRAAQFDVTTLRGDVQSKWEVELYHNGVLIAFTLGTDNGEWIFENVPLVYGANDFRIEYYGPQGQRKTEYRQSFIGDRQLAPGKFDYRMVVLEDDGDVRAAMGLEAGVTSWLSASLGGVFAPSTDNGAFVDVGLQAGLGGYGITADMSVAEDGGYAIGTSLHTNVLGGNIFINSEWLNNYQSELYTSSGGAQHFLEARANTSLSLFGNVVVPLTFSYKREERSQGNVRTTGTFRSSIAPGSVIITNDFSFRQEAVDSVRTSEATHSALLNYRLAWGNIRGEVQSRLYPQTELTSIRASIDTKLRDSIGVRLSIAMDPFTREVSYDANLRRQFANATLGVQLSQSPSGSALGLNLSGAFVRQPATGAWTSAPQGLAKGGAIYAEAFLDENLDGIRNDFESLLPAAQWKIDGRTGTTLPSAEGRHLLGRASPYQPARVDVDMTKLDDPYLVGPAQGAVVTTRPGRVIHVAAPLVRTGEIVGDVVVEKCGDTIPAADVEIFLISEATGDTVARISSEFDGFFAFDRVPYGTYRVQIDSEQLTRTGLTFQDDLLITIGKTNDSVTGIYLALHSTTDTPCRVPPYLRNP